jgi:hypothetical protein
MTTVRGILRKLRISGKDAAAMAEGKNEYYKFYSIPKPGGSPRNIEEPLGDLKRIQRALVPLFVEYPFHPACKAVNGENIKTNAWPHQQSEYVLKVDISKCYPSTQAHMILGGMWYPQDMEWYVRATTALPFCLINNAEGYLVLPTGAPTSPALCNIALTPLDYKINDLCEAQGYVYTRYIDDMHISTANPTRDWDILNQVKELVESVGYQVNTKKSKWYTVDERDNVIVTGIRVGQQNQVPRTIRRKIRAILEKHARNLQPLDDQASGYLAFVKGIDHQEYVNLIEYYQRRLNNAQDRQ